MKSNNHLIGLSNNATHIKNKLIHEHDFVREELKKQTSFLLSIVLLAEYTAVTFGARLCVKKHQYRGFANEKIQQY